VACRSAHACRLNTITTMLPLDVLKHLVTRSNEESYFDPVRNWLILLVFVTIAFIGILGWNIAAFNRVAGGEMLGATVEMRVAPRETFSLEEIESIFTARAEEEKKYRTGVYTFTDPSL
jgi:hypothetical protein